MRWLLCVALIACGGRPPGGGDDRIVIGGGGDATIRDGGAPSALWRDLPMQVWPTLDGRAEGLLITAISPWGTAIGWSKFLPGRHDRSSYVPYWFFGDGTSAQAVYFASTGQGHNFLRRWSVPTPGGDVRFDAAMFDPATSDPWGLDGAAHLVEVEVNRGAGAVPNLHFVITKARVLDGKDGYPVAADLLSTARATWDRWLASTEPRAAAELEAAARAAPGTPYGPETEEVTEGFLPGWSPSERRMRVTFVRRVARTSTRVERQVIAHECPPGAPCMPPHEEDVTLHRTYGVEMALEVVVAADGRVVDAIAYGPAATSASAR